MKKQITMIVLTLLSIIYGCLILPQNLTAEDAIKEPTPAELEQELNDMKRVTEEFCLLRDAGKIPQLTKDDHGSFEVVKISTVYFKRSSEYATRPIQEQLSKCDNVFKGDVTTKSSPSRKLRYFFCVRTATIDLMSVYEFKNAAWIKI
jgi:hypothetical protein